MLRATKNLLVLEQHKLLFVFSGKCGSRSLKQLAATMGYAKPARKESELRLPYIQPQQIKDYPNTVKVLLARNPWDRVCSLYKTKVFLRLTRRFADLGFEHRMPFVDFVERICTISDEDISAMKDYDLFAAANHWYSQTVFACDEEGNWVINDLVKLENLSEDWSGLQKDMAAEGVELPNFPHNDRKEPPHTLTYGKLYSTWPATIDMVAERYAEDIEHLGYENDRPQVDSGERVLAGEVSGEGEVVQPDVGEETEEHGEEEPESPA